MILRMGDRIVPPERRIARLGRLARRAQRLPHLGIERQVEVGQDHRALRQFGHDAQQVRQRGGGAGHAGRDDGVGRRLRLPAPRRVGEQQVATRRPVDLTARRKIIQPGVLDLQEGRRARLPVLGLVGGDADHLGIEQVVGRDAFHQQPVHRPPDLMGLPQQRRAAWAVRALHLAQDFGQAQPAPRRIGRGGDVRAVEQRIEQGPQRLVEIEIADHGHSRQQHPALAQAHERLGHGARGALAGQQQGQAGKAEVRLGVARDQPGGQCIREAAMGGDGIDLGASGPAFAPVRHASARPRWA